jgi:hypothetical protein
MREHDFAQPDLRVNLGVQGQVPDTGGGADHFRLPNGQAGRCRTVFRQEAGGVGDLCNISDGKLCKRRQIVL